MCRGQASRYSKGDLADSRISNHELKEECLLYVTCRYPHIGNGKATYLGHAPDHAQSTRVTGGSDSVQPIGLTCAGRRPTSCGPRSSELRSHSISCSARTSKAGSAWTTMNPLCSSDSRILQLWQRQGTHDPGASVPVVRARAIPTVPRRPFWKKTFSSCRPA